MIFCQAMYAAGATELTGSKYVQAIQTAKTVFFCAKPCAPTTRSPQRRPMARPTANCISHNTSATSAKATMRGISEAGSPTTKLTERPTTIISETDQM